MTLNREKLLELARTAGFRMDPFIVPLHLLERFASLVLSAAQQDITHEFKNFHRGLCARFGYTHDEVHWKRDQVSLEEHIASFLSAAREEREPVAPHIIEALSYHARERDDLTLDEALDYLRHGWKKVCGRSERELVLQITALLAGATVPPSSDQVWNEAVREIAQKLRSNGMPEATAYALSLKRPLQAQEQASQVGNFGDSSNAQLARRLESVPLPDYRQEPNIVDFHNGDASMWVEDGKVKAEWIRREPSASGAVSADANVDSQHSPVTDELPPLIMHGLRQIEHSMLQAKNSGNDRLREIDLTLNTAMELISALSRAQAAQQAQAVIDEQIDAAAHHLQEIIAQNGGSPSECAHDHIRDLRTLPSQSAAPVSEQPAAQTAEAQAIRALELISDGDGDAQVIAQESLDLIAGIHAGWIRQKPSAPGWYETKRDRDGIEITLWWNGKVWKASPNSPHHSYLYEDRSHRPIAAAPSPQGGDK